MAPPPGTLRVGRYFLALFGLLAVLYALIALPGERHTPKLGIDLVGGVRVVFTAITPHGSAPPSSSQMSQARQIMEDRINTYGVTGATVVVQGGNQLVIEIPAGTGADVARLGKAAILNFRGVMAPAQPISCVGKSPYGGLEFQVPASDTVTIAAVQRAFATAKTTIAGPPKELGTGAKRVVAADVRNTSATNVTSAQQKTITSDLAKSLGIKQSDVHAGPLCAADPFRSVINAQTSAKDKQTLRALLEPSLANHEVGLNAEKCPSPSMPDVLNNTAPCHAFSDLSATFQQQISAALRTFQCSAAQAEADIPYNYYLACDTNNPPSAFLMSHVVVKGQQISSAAAQAPNSGAIGGSLQWTVALKLHSSGADAWHAWTSKYNYPQAGSSNVNVTPIQTPGSTSPPCGPSASLVCSNFVAFTLDGQVISYPVTEAVLDVNTSISGNFTQSTAEALAKELNYGKLPLSFRAEANQHVSATLGSTQLRAAFLAGGIGLALVIIYSLLYYRALGLVTISSLIVSGTLTYAMLVILSKQIGFTLDLAGIAGFIVALGITADSFVVFFERMKDEVHEGRSLRVAVPRAWVRARRTILSADTVSFLAAAILYYFASADVKGFAFTLGMSTILDLVVVFLFTHPMVSMLSRLPAFGSARFTGLSAVRVGGIAPSSEDEPVPARVRRPRLRRAAAGEAEGGSAVAVLDEEPELPTAQPAAAESSQRAEPAGEADERPAPRRRSTPEPGTAAERAAARRARLREQQAEGKERR